MSDLPSPNEFLDRARELTTVNQPLPKIFNPLFRDQGSVNRALIESVQTLLEKHSELERRTDQQVRELHEKAQLMESRLSEQAMANTKLKVELHNLDQFSKSYIATLRGSVAELMQSRDALFSNLQAIRETLREEKASAKTGFKLLEQRMGDWKRTVESELVAINEIILPHSSEIAKLTEFKKNTSQSLRLLEATGKKDHARIEDLKESINELINKADILEKTNEGLIENFREWRKQNEKKTEEREATVNESLEQIKVSVKNEHDEVERLLDQLNKVLEEDRNRAKRSLELLEKNLKEDRKGTKRSLELLEKTLEEDRESTKRTLDHLEKNLEEDRESAKRTLNHLEKNLEVEREELKHSIDVARSSNAFVRRPGETSDSPTVELAISQEEFDSFYKRFEDQFRGNRESVFNKQIRHLDIVKDAVNELNYRPKLDVLDLGCGRGEWLELVGTAHLKNRGVDQNLSFVQQCLDRELDVVESDVLEYLDGLDENSCGAVTAFHIIEHLSFAELWLFYKRVLRVLAPGGVGIFETPNPNNLRVASHFFLTDITHVRPVPPSLAGFLASFHGAEKVEVQQYHPFPEAEKYSDLPEEINNAIYGPQDYAVVFYK